MYYHYHTEKKKRHSGAGQNLGFLDLYYHELQIYNLDSVFQRNDGDGVFEYVLKIEILFIL